MGASSAMRLLGYTRVSSIGQEQSGHSLDAQEHQLVQYATPRDWWIVSVVREQGSGKDLGRERLQETLRRLLNGEADGLIVTKLDRLTRSLLDFASLVEWFKDASKALVVLDMNLDMATPTGEAMANILATFAQFERQMIGQRTKDALAQKRRNGEPINQGSVVDRPEVVEIIQTLSSCGSSYRQICDELNSREIPTLRGGKTWYPSAIGSALGVRRRARRRSVSLPEIR